MKNGLVRCGVFFYDLACKLKFNHRETVHGRKHIKINHKILLAMECGLQNQISFNHKDFFFFFIRFISFRSSFSSVLSLPFYASGWFRDDLSNSFLTYFVLPVACFLSLSLFLSLLNFVFVCFIFCFFVSVIYLQLISVRLYWFISVFIDH